MQSIRYAELCILSKHESLRSSNSECCSSSRVAAQKQIGFARAQAPESALAYRKGKVRLLGIRALADALAGGEGAAIAAVPALERSDPGVDDGLADGIDGNDTD